MSTLDVIFRKDGDEVVAVFPSLPGTDQYDFTVYVHVGQHGTGVLGWYVLRTKPATEAEYAPLLAELRSIYERDGDCTLRVVQRMTARHRKERAEACRR